MVIELVSALTTAVNEGATVENKDRVTTELIIICLYLFVIIKNLLAPVILEKIC